MALLAPSILSADEGENHEYMHIYRYFCPDSSNLCPLWTKFRPRRMVLMEQGLDTSK
jgi:hypothetical protein